VRQHTISNSDYSVSQSVLAYQSRCDNGSNEDVLATPLTCPKAPSHSKISTPASRPRTKWEPEDDTRLVDIKNSRYSWKEIYAAFPHRTPGTIHVRCSTKLKSRLS
jgi:hypothetical protein